MNDEIAAKLKRIESDLKFISKKLGIKSKENDSGINTNDNGLMELYGKWEGDTSELLKNYISRRERSGRTN